MQIIKKTLPFLLLFTLLAILGKELFFAKPNELPSALLGEEVPPFQLPNLFPSQKVFTEKNLTGRISFLNIWASWCYACAIEHPLLLKISRNYPIPIYGINYKDNSKEAIAWLGKNGNPYFMIGNDQHGNTAIDLGVYGTPETFVISPQGKIIYRHVGAINQKVWDETLYPLIKKYERAHD